MSRTVSQCITFRNAESSDTLHPMSQTAMRVIATLFLLIGFAATGFIATQVSPYQSSGSLDLPAVALLFIGLLVGLTGLSTLLTLALHRRWPALAGVYPKANGALPQISATVSLRQGFLFSLSLCAILLFSMLQILDSIFIFVVFLLSGLIETYFQSLKR